MPVVEFTEIPSARGGSPDQEQWEYFARDFFDAIGFKVVSQPDRGPDGGKDLLIEETRAGPFGESTVRWLVSAKHFAPSGAAVGTKDEININDRLERHSCHGFISFYSTLPSSGLADAFKALAPRYELQQFDKERIETELTTNPMLAPIFKRYFPNSSALWYTTSRSPGPVEIFGHIEQLRCESCGKDLGTGSLSGIIALVRKRDDHDHRHIIDVYCACKGACDRHLERLRSPAGYAAGWNDLSDLAIPLLFLRWVIVTMTNIRTGRYKFEDDAFQKFKHRTLEIAHHVVRETTEDEEKQIARLGAIPSYLGGLGE